MFGSKNKGAPRNRMEPNPIFKELNRLRWLKSKILLWSAYCSCFCVWTWEFVIVFIWTFGGKWTTIQNWKTWDFDWILTNSAMKSLSPSKVVQAKKIEANMSLEFKAILGEIQLKERKPSVQGDSTQLSSQHSGDRAVKIYLWVQVQSTEQIPGQRSLGSVKELENRKLVIS